MLHKISKLYEQREKKLTELGNGFYKPKLISITDALKRDGIEMEFDAEEEYHTKSSRRDDIENVLDMDSEDEDDDDYLSKN